MSEPLVPIEGCWVCRRSAPARLGIVEERRLERERWVLLVRWGDGSREAVPLAELGCGLQPGWTVQDVPLSTVRRPLGTGKVVQKRELAGREQVLVQWDDTGRCTWVPYENLRRIKDPVLRFLRHEPGHEDAGERLRLRLLAYALETWNKLTGSLDRLDVDPLPHQIQLVHRILSSGNINWLIADDVGLGKTIEVGLLLSALKRRGRARRVLIVTPASLTRQWRDEMKYKFDALYSIYGVDFTIDDPARWKLYDHVIVSLDLAKRPDHRERLAAAGEWDVIVFDESHKLTRREDGERTERYRLAEMLRQHADAFLLLSATPHQGYTDRFKALLELVRPDLAPQIRTLESNPEIIAEMILRNRKTTVTDANGNFIFRGHEVHRIEITPSQTTTQFSNLLNAYLRRGYRVSETGGASARAIGFVMVIYRKLASSSIAAIEQALASRRERLSNKPIAPKIVDLEASDVIEGGDDQDDLSAFGPSTPFFSDEPEMLQTLLSMAARVRADDEKMRLFLNDVVKRLVGEGKKILIFTEYRATQEYIRTELERHFPGKHVVLINGSMDLTAKLEAINAFRDRAWFLVSTEAGGEGLNLHESCHVMVNYDLPWNPARLVQRIGRLYRYGQKEKVIVFNLHSSDTFDNIVIGHILDRVAAVARDMAPVSSEFHEGMYAEIVGELLENLDVSTILEKAALNPLKRTEAEIEEAIRRAQEARALQEDLLSYAVSFEREALGGALGLTMNDVANFVEAMLPFIEVSISRRLHDNRVLEIRLPDTLRGRFPEFHNRTLVRVTADRELARRLEDVVLLDFENSFFRFLVATAQSPQFGGTYATIASETGESGVLAAVRLRWQNDQGEPLVEEFALLHSNNAGTTIVNPPFVRDWLRRPIHYTQESIPISGNGEANLKSITQKAEELLHAQCTRFKHPNGLTLLALARIASAPAIASENRA